MANNGELPEVDPAYKEKGNLGGQFNYEQRSSAWQVREQLLAVVAEHLGKTEIYLEKIVGAIKDGVGEEHTLALKEIAQTSKGKEQLRSILNPHIYMAIISYEKS